MLPVWVRQGKPIVCQDLLLSYSTQIDQSQSISLPNNSRLKLPLIPLVITLFVFLYPMRTLLLPFGMDHASSGFTTSSFRVDKSDFLPPPPIPRPEYLPEPIPPKKPGMVVPDSVHYVYGLKPLSPGQAGEELPYYAYLAIRSAMIHLNPAKIYL